MELIPGTSPWSSAERKNRAEAAAANINPQMMGNSQSLAGNPVPLGNAAVQGKERVRVEENNTHTRDGEHQAGRGDRSFANPDETINIGDDDGDGDEPTPPSYATHPPSQRKRKIIGDCCENCGTTPPGGIWRRDKHGAGLCEACYCYALTNKVPRPLELEVKRRKAQAARAKAARMAAAATAAEEDEDDQDDDDGDITSMRRAGEKEFAPCCENCAAVITRLHRDDDGRKICHNCHNYIVRNGKDRPLALEEARKLTMNMTDQPHSVVEQPEPARRSEQNTGTKRGLTTSCVPCVYNCCRCDGGNPCGHCADVFDKNGQIWECYYDKGFSRPKGPKPEKYWIKRTTRASGNGIAASSSSSAYSQLSAAFVKGSLATLGGKDQRTVITAANYRGGGLNNTLPTPNTTPAFSPSAQLHPAHHTTTQAEAPCKSISSTLQKNLESVQKIVASHPDNDFLRTAAEKSAVNIAMKLQVLKAYLQAEEEILREDLPGNIKEGLVKGNYEGYKKDVEGEGF